MAERPRYEPGSFCWVGLATSDPAGAKPFYATLFGWEGEDLPAGTAGSHTLLRLDGREVALLYRQTPEARSAHAPPHWTAFVSVADADATAARAVELGGAAVFRAPFDVLDDGRVAAIRDPLGAILSLWQARARTGAELLNAVGALCFNELATTDVERSRTFYGGLFGWEYESDGGGYTTIDNAGHGNGAMRVHAERQDGAPAGWLPYFLVEDTGAAQRMAEQAGGRTLAPTTESTGRRRAVLADPQGARFAVVEAPTGTNTKEDQRWRPT